MVLCCGLMQPLLFWLGLPGWGSTCTAPTLLPPPAGTCRQWTSTTRRARSSCFARALTTAAGEGGAGALTQSAVRRLQLLNMSFAMGARRYDKHKILQKEVGGTQFVACLNPTAGSFFITPRMQRHFATFAIQMPSQDVTRCGRDWSWGTCLPAVTHRCSPLVTVLFPRPFHL